MLVPGLQTEEERKEVREERPVPGRTVVLEDVRIDVLDAS